MTTSRPAVGAYPAWEYAFLKLIGAPQNQAQLEALNLWARAEGLPDGANNWLAFTAPTSNLNEWGQVGSSSNVDHYGGPRQAIAPGQWNIFHNGDYSVLTFPTMAAGVQALYEFLSHGHQGILTELKNPEATVTSIGDAITADGGWGNDGKKIISYSGGNPDIYTGGGQTGGGSNEVTGGFTKCDSSKAVIGEGGIFGIGKFTLLNQCQAKALVGGIVFGLGLSIIGGGMAILITTGALRSPVGRTAVDLIPTATPAGNAIKNMAKTIRGR